MTKNTRKRSPSQVARQRRKIAEMYLQGRYQEEIAAELGLAQSTVSRDLKHLLDEWQEETKGDIDQRKAELKQMYSLIWREAYAAWLRSKEDAVTETQEAVEGEAVKLDAEGNPIPGKQRLKVSTRREGQSGNPALLAQAQAALKAIREMFGVDAAQKLEHSGSFEANLIILPSKNTIGDNE